MDIFGEDSRKGFTITEIMIATLIMVMVVGGALAVYIMSQTAWYEGSAQIALQRKASVAMEKMVRGIDPYGRNGIREAREVSSPSVGASATQIYFVDAEAPNPTRSFYFSSGPDGDPGTVADNQLRYIDQSGNDTPIIENNVRTLGFSQPSNGFIEINLSLEDMVRDRVIIVDLSTDVKIRN